MEMWVECVDTKRGPLEEVDCFKYLGCGIQNE